MFTKEFDNIFFAFNYIYSQKLYRGKSMTFIKIKDVIVLSAYFRELNILLANDYFSNDLNSYPAIVTMDKYNNLLIEINQRSSQ